jgi:hypothetical protein
MELVLISEITLYSTRNRGEDWIGHIMFLKARSEHLGYADC